MLLSALCREMSDYRASTIRSISIPPWSQTRILPAVKTFTVCIHQLADHALIPLSDGGGTGVQNVHRVMDAPCGGGVAAPLFQQVDFLLLQRAYSLRDIVEGVGVDQEPAIPLGDSDAELPPPEHG